MLEIVCFIHIHEISDNIHANDRLLHQKINSTINTSHVMLYYTCMVICKAPLTGGYSETLSA